MDKLEATFNDKDLKFKDGESSNEAMKRIIDVVYEIDASNFNHTVIVAHGGIISLLLHHFDKKFGFEQWKKISNPDVFLLKMSQDDFHIQRLWEE